VPWLPRPLRNAAIGSVSCLTFAAAAFLYGASLDDHNTPWFLLLTFFALMALPCIIAYAAVTSWQQRHPAVSYRRDRGKAARPRRASAQQHRP
jgi:hypothetical protein